MNQRPIPARAHSFATTLALALASLGVVAHADPPTAATLAVTHGQFTDRVDHMRPVGDATALAGARTAVYWLQIHNPGGAPTQVTLVWSANSHDVYRQNLVVNRADMVTWAFLPLHHYHQIGVRVLDASGATIHTDTASLDAAAPAPVASAH